MSNTDKKKTIDKSKEPQKPVVKKKANDKLKFEEDQKEELKDSKVNLNTIAKNKKMISNNADNNTTPKAVKKPPEKKFINPIVKTKKTPYPNEGTTPKNSSNAIILVNSSSNPLTVSSNSTGGQKSQKDTPTKSIKKLPWNQNPLAINYLNALSGVYQNKEREIKESVLTQLCQLKEVSFFTNLHDIKAKMNELIGSLTQPENTSLYGFDYQKILLAYLECTMNKVEGIDIHASLIQQQQSQLQEYNSTNLSDNEVTYLFKKDTCVSFEIPIIKKRALSTRIENRLNVGRRSSEEISMGIQQKLANAEQRKESFKKMQHENFKKIKERISEIKQKQKKEKKDRIQKLHNKLEKMNMQQQKFLQDKIQIVKNEHEKVAEINYLHRLEKENKDVSILRKLDISIERRNKYLKERLSKTVFRHHPKSISEALKENLISSIDYTSATAFEAMDRKKQVEAKIEFMKKVFNENFIWELMEADHFDINELYNLSSITKYELMKSKLRKEKEVIDKLFEGNNAEKSKWTSKNSVNTTSIWNETFSSMTDQDNKTEDDPFATVNNDIVNNNNNDEINEDQAQNTHGLEKRSKSFTMFNDEDYFDVNYLFDHKNSPTTKKKKKKNKKKKKTTKKIVANKDEEEDDDGMTLIKDEKEINENTSTTASTTSDVCHFKNRLFKTINSMSQTDLRSFYTKVTHDKKMRRFLIKSKKDGKYIQSKLIISEEDNASSGHQQDDSHNSNSHNSKDRSDEHNNSNKSFSSYHSPKKVLTEQEKLAEEKKEKIFQDIIQTQDLTMNNSTIIINSDSVANLLEKNQITIRWCKICNMILPSDQDSNTHINKPEHQRIKKEYGLSLQEESNTVMLFKSVPGDINEDLKNERVNAIKLRVKKLKQKISLKAIKHENFGNSKQDTPSANKQRIQKLSFEIEKQSVPNIKDYETLETLLKDLIKVLEQKKQNDLHILRQVKLIQYLVDILKKPPGCHKSEIKSLGKILELIVKILLFFSSLLDNRNYMIVTNRISVVADLLLWVLNKPSKIPLGISFLPDLLQILIIHIKHRIPFEYLYMKDDTLEYIFLSNILIKFKQKYASLTGPIDLTSGFGSFPFVLLKSLSMFESLTMQININYRTKPVYIKQNKISENILYIFEYTELIGLIHLLTVLLLSNGPIKQDKINVQPQTVIAATLMAVKVINNICRIDLNLVQGIVNSPVIQDQMQHIASYIMHYSLVYLDSSDDIKELLHETIILIGYLSLSNETFQLLLSRGEITLLQHICSLPFSYFSEKQLKDILIPSLITMTYANERNTQIISNEMSLELIVMFLKEKIQLEPIIEEDISEVSSSTNNNDASNLMNMMIINKEQFLTANNDKAEKKNERIAFSTASSTKSCHDMISGASDFVPLYHRFPFNLWDKAQEYYATYGKKK